MSSSAELEEAVRLAPVVENQSMVKIKAVLGVSSPRESKKAEKDAVDPTFKPSVFHDFLKSIITPENIERCARCPVPLASLSWLFL